MGRCGMGWPASGRAGRLGQRGVLALMLLATAVGTTPVTVLATGPDAAEPEAVTQAPVAEADAAAIKEVVRKYVAAREENDAKAVAALFTAEADQLVSSGEWRRGREALVSGAMASSQRSSGKRTVTIETVRSIAPGVALADGRYEIGASPGNAARQMWSSFVMVKGTSGGWQIAAIRNMLPAPPPPAAAGGR